MSPRRPATPPADTDAQDADVQERLARMRALYAGGRHRALYDEARALVAIAPSLGIGWKLLGVAAQREGRLDEALAAKRRAVELLPGELDVHVNLGNALRVAGRLEEAEVALRGAVALHPGSAEAHNMLAVVLERLGRIDEARAGYEAALAANPAFVQAHSNLLFMLTHQGGLSPQELLAAHRAYDERHGAPLRTRWRPHDNVRDPERRLRVGFVSGDLREHAVARFVAPLWRAFDRGALELFAYSTNDRADATTATLRGLVDGWREVWRLGDEALAEMVRRDRIDILFDLSGHTAHNRLPVFARKPAPVQVTAIGYPYTTGLSAIDYRITDRFRTPARLAGQCVERLVWIPCSSTFEHGDAPPVAPLPALAEGRFTFGSFQRPSKITAATLSLWARVLHAVPDARLLVGAAGDPAVRTRVLDGLVQHGVAAARVGFAPPLPFAQYLAAHARVDLLLDTVPYPSGTTAHHGLWMGVPTLTRTAEHLLGWQCAGMLGRLGLDDFVAHDDDGYVRLASRWAAQPAALAALRAGLRERIRAHPLLQPATVAAGMQAALRAMWRRWCAGRPAESFEVGLD